MNHLIHESSPYLLQHAHNPVNWFAWGEAAFTKAKEEDKPILLSIGYSTCHWCHVMERESFEDEETAAFMNTHFINIKLDREEFPELDKIYMEAVQYLQGHGGWPLNVFLLPDKRPFFGGTYYPPFRRQNMPSWLDVLNNIKDAWNGRRQVVIEQSEKIAELIREGEVALIKDAINPEIFSKYSYKDDINSAYIKLSAQFDRQNGGFGHAPKFPSFMALSGLLHHYFYYNDKLATDMVKKSLDSLILGGIYDQVGGGISRYATDEAWNIPHFEKMLYDNALLLETLGLAVQNDSNDYYKEIAAETFEFLEREMKDETCMYYSALDADSEGVEGKFYVWDFAELKSLNIDHLDHLLSFYNVQPEGNWEHSNILYSTEYSDSYALKNNLNLSDWNNSIREFKKSLLTKRIERIRPGLDFKIILSWNAMLIPAFLKLASLDKDKEWSQNAINLFEQLKTTFSDQDHYLSRVYTKGQSRLSGNLDDYAYMIRAAIGLHQFTGESDYLSDAVKWTAIVRTEFNDPVDGLFFMTAEHNSDVFVRVKELYDLSSPSSNAVMMENLWLMGWIIDEMAYREQATSMLSKMWISITKYPLSFSYWFRVGLRIINDFRSVEIVGSEDKKFRTALNCHFIPGSIIKQHSIHLQSVGISQVQYTDSTYAIVCSETACTNPLSSPEELINALK
jgi:uncharacterized protein YyaL (SSP411 family)